MQILVPPPPLTISIPDGGSTIPLVELDKDKVAAKGKNVRRRKKSNLPKIADCSFGDFKEHLSFTSWQFFHAAKKTELAASVLPEKVQHQAQAFGVEYEDAFVWNTGNFRKTDRSVFALADFDSARLAGRVGEAIAYLTMVKWGYVYWDRCTTVWQRAARVTSIKHDEQLRAAHYVKGKRSSREASNAPDFVFEKSTGDIALMEAKGSFVHPANDNPSAKADLSQALTQLKAWSEVIAPTPRKSFGIGTYLREESDGSDDPSLVTFVDPEGEGNDGLRPVEFPADIIRRCNYGAWLKGMGLISAGRALHDLRPKAAEAFSLPVVRIGNQEFAITQVGWKLPLFDRYDFIDPWWSDFRYWRHHASTALIMGIEANSLRLIGEAIREPGVSVLLRIASEQNSDVSPNVSDTTWSIMPDGTCLGVLSGDSLENALVDRQTFVL